MDRQTGELLAHTPIHCHQHRSCSHQGFPFTGDVDLTLEASPIAVVWSPCWPWGWKSCRGQAVLKAEFWSRGISPPLSLTLSSSLSPGTMFPEQRFLSLSLLKKMQRWQDRTGGVAELPGDMGWLQESSTHCPSVPLHEQDPMPCTAQTQSLFPFQETSEGLGTQLPIGTWEAAHPPALPSTLQSGHMTHKILRVLIKCINCTEQHKMRLWLWRTMTISGRWQDRN